MSQTSVYRMSCLCWSTTEKSDTKTQGLTYVVGRLPTLDRPKNVITTSGRLHFAAWALTIQLEQDLSQYNL